MVSFQRLKGVADEKIFFRCKLRQYGFIPAFALNGKTFTAFYGGKGLFLFPNI